MRKLLVVLVASSLLATGCSTGSGTVGTGNLMNVLGDAQNLGNQIAALGSAYTALGNPNPTNDLITQAIDYAKQASQLSSALGPLASGNTQMGGVMNALSALSSFNGSTLLGSTNPLERQQGFSSFLGGGQSLVSAATGALAVM